MRNYYQVRLLGGKMLPEALQGNFIGVNYTIHQDLSNDLPDQWKEFNRKFIPVWLDLNPGRSRVAAGLSCGMLWTVSKGINIGDIVLSPDGEGNYYIAEVAGDYQYIEDYELPHQRRVQWHDHVVQRDAMSFALQKSLNYSGGVCNVSDHREELEKLISGIATPKIVATDESIEDPYQFALESHLEEFLIRNWKGTELGQVYDIYDETGDLEGQQYITDTGRIDILARSKDKKTLLVIELKRGRASDQVVGQILRYMGYVKEELAEPDQQVKGIIIALEDDTQIQRALCMVPNIKFYRYKVDFELLK